MGDEVAVFDSGRIVQVGPPREVYLRPRTRFVADFIGEANILDISVAAGTASAAGIGPIPMDMWSGDAPPLTDAQHFAAVRPEDVTVSPDASGRFTVLDATFIGGDLHAVVDLGTHTLTSRQPAADAAGMCSGDRCEVSFRPGSLRVVEA